MCKPAFDSSHEPNKQSLLANEGPAEYKDGGFMEEVRQELEDLEPSLTQEMVLGEPAATELLGGEI